MKRNLKHWRVNLMSKEWVEDKKKQLENATVFINENGNEAVEISLTVLNKLFEQAQRADELERKNYDLREDLAGRHSTVEELNEKIDELWKQNKRLREDIQEAMELNHDENFNYDVDKVLLKALGVNKN